MSYAFAYRYANKYIRIIIIFTLLFIICMGAIMVVAPVKPFWVDEWFIIHNLKSKSIKDLLGAIRYDAAIPKGVPDNIEIFGTIASGYYCSIIWRWRLIQALQ
jgi:hypothetical protein